MVMLQKLRIKALTNGRQYTTVTHQSFHFFSLSNYNFVIYKSDGSVKPVPGRSLAFAHTTRFNELFSLVPSSCRTGPSCSNACRLAKPSRVLPIQFKRNIGTPSRVKFAARAQTQEFICPTHTSEWMAMFMYEQRANRVWKRKYSK